MKTVHKLILKSYLGPMILTFFIVMFVLIMQFMWRYIDELVGKGLGLDVIGELMLYAMASLIPMGLPLATLLAAIMTLGNMGENYELLALKSAGISLPRIMKPLIILVFCVAIGSFFVANNLVPLASKKMFALLYDIRQQKQSIDFKDGIFFNGIDGISIRVEKQDPRTKLLKNILIYDTRKLNGDMNTTVADSGYITMTEDKKFLLVTLYNGETYEESRNFQWYENSVLQHHLFDTQNAVIPLSGFDFERSDDVMPNSWQTKNIVELTEGIDSLRHLNDVATKVSYAPLVSGYLFTHDASIIDDSIQATPGRKEVYIADAADNLSLSEKSTIYETTLNSIRNLTNSYSYDEQSSKDILASLYKHEVEWHRKISLPVSIMIFFLIGAPLGAIIRKGGLGMPIVISVLFFVIYYIISITGEKMTREGTWSAISGMWISTFILLPISVYLTYKATNDSNLLNAEWYINKWKKIVSKFKK